MEKGVTNGPSHPPTANDVAARHASWGRQSSTASIRDRLERQESTGSAGSARKWSPEPGERGEYRKLQNDMQIMTFKVKSLEEKVDKVVRGVYS